VPFLSGFRGGVDLSATVLPETPKNENKVYQKKNVGEDQNEYVRMASEISNNNLDFIATVNQENGIWKIDRISPKNKNGTRDHGFCQLNSAYHWSFISSDGFKDPRTQLEYCWKVYQQRPTAFYGYYLRKSSYNKFELI
jgi:hypothetical protein